MSSQKKITQEELRRLMKERSASKSKITSAHAKYNSLQQLLCTLCGVVVKSELQWNAHVLGRTHKENLVKATVPAKPPVKRRQEDLAIPTESKRIASGERETSRLKSAPVASNDKESTALANNMSLSQNDPEDDDDSTKKMKPSESPVKDNATSRDDDATASLPPGFFDDPKLDAKARNVPFKDKMDEEMEKFQKAIREETEISEAIMDEDYEEQKFEKEIEEIDESMAYWQRLYAIIQKKKLPIHSTNGTKDKGSKSEEDDDDDDEDETHDHDWRMKLFEC